MLWSNKFMAGSELLDNTKYWGFHFDPHIWSRIILTKMVDNLVEIVSCHSHVTQWNSGRSEASLRIYQTSTVFAQNNIPVGQNKMPLLFYFLTKRQVSELEINGRI